MVLVLLFLILAFVYPLHFIDDWADGSLFWNFREAYLCAGLARNGYRTTPAGYVIGLISGYFNLPSMRRAEVRGFTVVFHITSEGIERVVAPDQNFSFYMPYGGAIYAWHEAGPPWKWDGTHFAEVSPEGAQVIPDPRTTVSKPKEDFTERNGWSAKHSLTGWPSQFEINLGGKPVKFFVKLMNSYSEVSVDVQLPNGRPQQVLHAKSAPYLVTGGEYARTFRKTGSGEPSKP